MKRILFIMIALFIQNSVFSQTPVNDLHWKETWKDDFNFLNTGKWSISNYGTNRNEPQMYLADQVWVSNGNLVIEVNNTKVNCPNDPPYSSPGYPCSQGKQYNYRSGDVITNDAFHFGYIEALIKLPFKSGKKWGFFPAFWTINAGITYSNAAEIDIFEMFGGKDDSPTNVNTCYHWCYDGSCWQSSGRDIKHELDNFDIGIGINMLLSGMQIVLFGTLMANQ